MTEEKYQRIISIISGNSGINETLIFGNTDLYAELGLDELTVVRIILALEGEFSVAIPDEDIAILKTPKDIEKYLEK